MEERGKGISIVEARKGEKKKGRERKDVPLSGSFRKRKLTLLRRVSGLDR